MLLEEVQILETLYFDAFRIQNPLWLELLRSFQLGFSHLNENEFKHTFRGFLNPLTAYRLEPETLSHPLFAALLLVFQVGRAILLNNIKRLMKTL